MLFMTAPRHHWRSQDEFFFATMGMCLGLSNLWKFPNAVYHNGGLVFIIVYALLVAVIALPMMYLEIFLGQFSSLTVPGAFGGFPLAKGIGWIMLYFTLVSCSVYMTIVVHGVFYLYYSFSSTLPWTTCKQMWTDSMCYERDYRNVPCMRINATLARKYASQNYSEKDALAIPSGGSHPVMVPGAEYNAMRSTCLNATQTSTEQFLLKKVMRLSSGFDEVDGVNIDTFLVIAVCWLAGFLAVSKGIRSYAKVATFAACTSYVLMFMLFLSSVVQRGSLHGLNAYFRMEWEKLGELKTWRSATQQLLYSSGLGIGLVTCYGSYKHFAWPMSPTIVKLIISDFLFSLLSGCVALSLSGHATTLYGMDLDDVVVSGYEYAFVAYPESVKHFGHAELWCIAFYLLLCILAFSDVLAYLVTSMSAFEDMYPSIRECRTLFNFTTCAVLLCCSLPTVTGGGLYLLNLIDATIYLDLLPWIALAEVILIVQGYGTPRLRHDIRFMTEQFPSAYFTICWSYICPLALMIVSLGTVTSKRTELFHYTYPEWSGIMTLAIILSCIFAVTTQILRIFAENNNDIYAALEPEEDYGPADAETRIRYQDEMAARNMLVPSNSSRSRKSMALTSTSANPSTALGASTME